MYIKDVSFGENKGEMFLGVHVQTLVVLTSTVAT